MKKNKTFDIRTYNNEMLHATIGGNYGGEGYSGLTDGVDVQGKLTEINYTADSATIFSTKLNMPCAIKMRSLYAL